MRLVVVIALVVSLLLQLIPRWQADARFEMMPIFTPVSLQYEQQLRQGTAPLNIRQAMMVLEDIDEKIDRGTVEEKDLLQLRENRKKMLEFRNRRHDLNIAMMNLAVEIVQELDPEQWNIIQSQRDAIQAKVEMEIFDDLLRRLQAR